MSGGIPDRNNFNSGNQPQSSVVEQERKLNEIMNQVQTGRKVLKTMFWEVPPADWLLL